MIIETPVQLEVEEVIGTIPNIEANISSESLPFLFEMLSGSLYSDAIASICRELTSNCFDSHIEAKVDDLVVIKKDSDEEGTYISFIDVGVGLSPTRMKRYMSYFDSTKRETNDFIGGFGLGSKSPLSYTSYFYIITVSEGIKYQYILSKGSKIPTLDLLDSTPTTDRNGTEIRIYLKDTYGDDYKFNTALSKQLCYFDNVYFDGWDIDNNYTIFEGTYFKYRNKNQYDKYMHIVLDKVVYPIDWKQLGRTSVNIAVAVKFKIGELLVTPNREQLRYTDEIIELLNDRINKTIEELTGIFNKQNKAFDSYFEWLNQKSNDPFITFTRENGEIDKLHLYGLPELKKKVLYKGFEGIEYLSNVNNLLSHIYRFAGTISDHKLRKDKHQIDITHTLNKYDYRSYISNTSYLSADKNWLVRNGYVFYPKIDFNSVRSLFIVTDYATTFGARYFNLGAGIKIYKLIKGIRDEVSSRSKVYRTLTEEEQLEYSIYKRENNSSLQKKLNGKTFVTSISQGTSYDWNLDKYGINGSERIPINKYTGMIIYGFKEDEVKLNKAFLLLRIARCNYFNQNDFLNSSIAKVIKISRQNEKYFKNKPNMYHVDNIYNNEIFRDAASSFKIELFFKNIEKDTGQETISYIKEIKNINNDIGEILDQLYLFYSSSIISTRRFNYTRESLKDDILKVANEYNLFNPEIELLFTKVNDWFKDVEIIRYVEINKKTLPYILKHLYSKKKKLNVEYYQKVLNTDKTTQLKMNFNETIVTGITKFNLITQNVL